MKKLLMIIFLQIFLLSCQPYGTATTNPCQPRESNAERLQKNLVLFDNHPSFLMTYEMFKKLKVTTPNRFSKEIIRLVGLIISGEEFSSRADIENVSSVFRNGNHSLSTDTDYLDFIVLLKILSTNDSYEDTINTASSIWLQSQINAPTVGDLCSGFSI